MIVASLIIDVFLINVWMMSLLLVPFRAAQSLSSRIIIEYELPLPAVKFWPTMRITLFIPGIVFAILSILFVTIMVRSIDEAGGRLILTKTVPISSSGTKLEEVVFINMNSPIPKMTTVMITIHFFPERKETVFVYFSRAVLNPVLKSS